MHALGWSRTLLAAPRRARPALAEADPGAPRKGDVAECRGCGHVFVWRRVRGTGPCARCRGLEVGRWKPA